MATAIAPPEVRIEAGPSRGALPVLLAGVFTSLLDFYSALTRGYPHAFGLSLVVMAAFGLAVAALVQLLRRAS